jgi:predicted TIM-barrel fold metal-dependent hydrolase
MSGTNKPQPYYHSPVNAAWLARRRETILDPALPIVDAHHHIWDRRGEEYLLGAFFEDVGSGHNVRGSVFIQCGFAFRAEGPPAFRPVGETEAIAGMAEEFARQHPDAPPLCQGIVGYADLRLGDRVAEVLERHLEAGRGRFKGIRQNAARDSAIVSTMTTTPPFSLLRDAEFRRGFARLAVLGLSFDAWIYHPQIPELIDLAASFPDVPVVLNHVGGLIGVGPYAERRAETFAAWRRDIGRLAALPNCFVKLGGLARPVVGARFNEAPDPPSSGELAAAWRPEIEACIEAFGPARSMFESNFPVDKGQCGYAALWNAYKLIVGGCSASERADLFAGAARRFYRLGL